MPLTLSDVTINRILLVASCIAMISSGFLYLNQLLPWSMWSDFIASLIFLSGFMLRHQLSGQRRLELLILIGTAEGIISILQNPFASDGMLILGCVMALSFVNWQGTKSWLVPVAAFVTTAVMAILIGLGYVHYEARDLQDLNNFGLWFTSSLCLLLLAIVMGLAIRELKNRLFSEITKLNTVNQQMFQTAYFDEVSGLANRKYFQQQVDAEIQLQRPFKVIALELIGIGQIGALHGQVKADEFLREVAQLIQHQIKDRGFVARLHGNRFVLLTNQMETARIQLVFEQFRAALSGHEAFSHLGLSFYTAGTEYPTDGQSYLDLMKNIDVALQCSNCQTSVELCFFSTAMAQQLNERQQLRQIVLHGLQQKQFYAVYQTKIAASSEKVVGLEGLARLCSDGPFISPAQFIPMLHAEGWMEQFGQHMLETIIADIPKLLTLYGDDIKVAANVSPPMFLSVDFLQFLQGCLSRHQVHACNLTIEITEEVFSSDVQRIIQCCRELQQLGVCISLDDFGTGFSSLSYLQLIQFDEIKIDRSFVRDIATGNNALLLLSSMCQLSRELGSSVVIEGIEEAQQYEMVKALADEIQGFYFSKPLPIHALTV
jgi:diguanylate cyclase (GGDEF)-like protein